MKKKLLGKLKRTFKSFSGSNGKTALGLKSEGQVRKLISLGQEVVVMRMG